MVRAANRLDTITVLARSLQDARQYAKEKGLQDWTYYSHPTSLLGLRGTVAVETPQFYKNRKAKQFLEYARSGGVKVLRDAPAFVLRTWTAGWSLVSEQAPPPNPKLCVVCSEGIVVTAYALFGMHKPKWVLQLIGEHGEAPTAPMNQDDWWTSGLVTSY